MRAATVLEMVVLATRERWSRSIRIQSGLPKSRLRLQGKSQICRFTSVLFVSFEDTTLTQGDLYRVLKRNAIRACSFTCPYVHLRAICYFQIYSTGSYLRSVEKSTQIQIRSRLVKSTYDPHWSGSALSYSKPQCFHTGPLRLGASPRSSDYPRTQVQAEADYPNSG